MKALTVKEPWASLIVQGFKKYEFRSWKTNYRGKVLIHAGLSKENIDDLVYGSNHIGLYAFKLENAKNNDFKSHYS